MGDILGHANPANFTDGGNLDPRSAAELEMTTNNRQAQQGDLISNPVRSSNFDDITNYQLGLWFDTQYLSFEGFDAAASGALSSVVAGTTQTVDGRLSVSWFNLAGTGINAGDDEVLFTVRFRANANISDLNGLLEVRSQWMVSEAYNSAEERKGIILNIEYQAVTSTDEPLEAKEGYRLQGTLSNIYRAIRETDQSHVVIKLSTQKTLKERTIQSFRREFELGRQVNSPYVVRYLDLHQDLATDEIALVMESDADDAAVELASILSLQGVSNAEFLKIAIQIVQGLQAIHAANIVHHDLKFSNILIRPIARTIKIIDFNLASSLPQQTQSTISIRGGTLASSSPEQTGRINRSVDYRTDFYSLGVVFYQLLCGQLPFTAKDAMGMIHQHLAKQPLPPHQYNSSIASALTQIVMKLLEKEAENRYQSCEGILYDLTCCQSALQQTSCIPEYELGQQDFSNKLTLSQHLYGREKEIKALVTAFERVSEGHREGFMDSEPRSKHVRRAKADSTRSQGYLGEIQPTSGLSKIFGNFGW